MAVCALFIFPAIFLSLRWFLSIVRYVSGNFLLYNSSTQYLSGKCFLVMLLSTMSELINRILLKASSASLSVPFMYFISGPYHSNIRHQCSTLSVVKFSNVIFLWSVYTSAQLYYQNIDENEKSAPVSPYRIQFFMGYSWKQFQLT